MSLPAQTFARYSLAFLWLSTALTSLFGAPEIGYRILAQAGIHGVLAELCVWGGGLLDMILGLWVLSGLRPQLCITIQMATIVLYSVLLTLIAPEFWLHPFGPVTKNLPVLALLALLKSHH